MASGTAEYDAVIRDIVRYVYYDQITSASAYSRARLALLDALGCAIETVQLSADCRALLGPVVVGATVPITGVRIPGTDYVVDPLKGAFDIGALIRYLDHNDAYAGAEWGHPSDNLGAILSVADWLSQQRSSKGELSITMQTVLTAQIKAYEIQGVLQQTNAFNTRGIDHVVLVKVASTAVVVWMLGLPETAALAAVSHAWVDGHALRTYRQAPNAGPRKGWAAGDACMRAVHLGLLVERANREGQGGLGAMLGMPTAITAPQWGLNDVLLGGDAITQGYPFGSGVVETALFKLMAAEGHGISAVEAAVEVAAQLQKRGLTADQDIESIRIRTQRPAMIIIDKPGGSTKLRNSADRDHSLQYMVAVTLMKRAAVEAVDYLDSAPWATDARVDALQQRITVVEDAGFTADYYDPDVRSVANAISVCLVGGQPLNEVTVAFPIGHHKRAETHAGVVEKFRTNMGLMFSDDEVERIIRAVEDDKTAVNYFMGLRIDVLSLAHIHSNATSLMEEPPVTAELCKWIAGLSLTDIPPEQVTRAKYLILDALACALIGAHLPWSEDAVRGVLSIESPGHCGIIGWEKKTGPLAAALLNSTFIQGFELDDYHSVAPIHSGSIVIPTLLAVLEHCSTTAGATADNTEQQFPSFRGADFLLAAIVGYETGPRVGLGVYGIDVLSQGWHSGAIFGPAAAAAAAAKLLRLPAAVVEDAVGIACTQAGGLMSAQYESTVKRMQHGFAARNGLFAALMARTGYTGIKQVLERPYGGFLHNFSLGNGRTPAYCPDRVVEGLGTHWVIDQIVVKPYASMAATHSAIDGIASLQTHFPLQMAALTRIQRITVEMSEPAWKKAGWAPTTRPFSATAAQMTAAYAVAMQLLEGQVQVAQFSPAQLRRDDVWAIMGRVTCVQSPSLSTYQQRIHVEVEGPDGRVETLSEFVDAPRGNKVPLSNEEILEKWRRLVGNVIDRDRQVDIERMVLSLDTLEDVQQMARLLIGRSANVFLD